ncbi:uncharacterized protein HMPREF1541_09412, partial [Cyphellophora europaea CBS 101466]
MAKLSVEELSKHDTVDDAWIVINGTVWDVTEFAPRHPGGAEIINEYLGGDATNAYNEVHGPSLAAKYLDESKNKGELDESTVTDEWRSKQADKHESSKPVDEDRPPLDAIINLNDFEDAAKRAHSKKTWAFQMTAANDCFTRDANADFYRRIWFRPRVLVGVKDVSTSATILGQKFKLPIFSSPAALAKLSHPEGERAMARGLAASGSTIIACNNASFSFSEIAEVLPPGHPLFYQLYFNRDRRVTEKLVREVSRNPNLKAITVTVDLPVVGKREDDERVKIEATYKASKNMQSQNIARDNKGSGLARATGSFIDPALNWDDLLWLQSITDVPIFVKGIQCAADARKALEYGCRGIYISNMAAGRSTRRSPASSRCWSARRIVPRCWSRWRCGSTAASAGAPTCSRPSVWALVPCVWADRSCMPWAMGRRAWSTRSRSSETSSRPPCRWWASRPWTRRTRASSTPPSWTTTSTAGTPTRGRERLCGTRYSTTRGQGGVDC